MATIVKKISNLVTCKDNFKRPKRGFEQSEIGLIKNGYLITDKDKFVFSGSENQFKKFIKKNKIKISVEIDGSGKTVMPGFIDSHTHLVFAGSRSDEYEMRIQGKTYEEIAQAGGGIASTVRHTRKESKKTLYNIAEKRLKYFLKYGTTTIESKSGYGLDLANEKKMLEVINDLNISNKYGIDILPTFLGAHSVPKGISIKEYIEVILYEMIPQIASKKLAVFIDVFCEKGYFNADETYRILEQGIKFGLIPKIHTEQFNSIGGIDAAVKANAVSVDHLEVLKDRDIKKLKNKNIIATLLPGVSYFLNISYPPARKLIENSVPVALATDFNPGSCMTENLQIIMSLASLKMKMTAEEILNAVTLNAAYSLYCQNLIGSIEVGKQADYLIFDFPSYKDLIYNFGVNRLLKVVKKGKVFNID